MNTVVRCAAIAAAAAAVSAFAPPPPAAAAPPAVSAAPATAARQPDTKTTANLRAMLRDYRRYAETLWHDAPPTESNQKEGWWGSGKGDGGNEGVRAQANTALVYALLSRDGDSAAFPASVRVEPALRYAARIHVTGGGKGADGKPWGDTWQSAMWAANLGVASYLVRDQLSPETRAAIERVVAHEADRFTSIPPPNGQPGDTKAEENAWDLTAPAAALLLMPANPHAGAWQEAVLRYGFNTLSVAADKTSPEIADGRPIREWVTTTQIAPDYTLENHGIFHPVYAMVAPATMAQAAVLYTLAHRPIPDALKHNVLPEWRMLQYVTLPDGEWLYPQGLDWDLHDYEHLHYWTLLATLFHDPAAAVLEERTVAQARRRQLLNGSGAFVGPTGSLGFAREAVQAERVAFALLMHQQFGDAGKPNRAALQKMIASLAPARVFDGAGFAVYRSPRGVFSFSWENRLMGLVAPSPEAYPDSPYVTTPYRESVVGGFTLEGQSGRDAGKFTMASHTITADASGFVASVDATINAGALRQQIAVAAVAPGVLVYVDRVTALRDVTITEERAVSLGIENDDVSGDRRKVAFDDNEPLQITGGAGKDYPLKTLWANVDNRLGLISPHLPGGRLVYRAAGKANRAGAREDILFAQPFPFARSFKTGEVVGERTGIVLPDVSAKATAAFARGVRVERSPQGIALFFRGSDNRDHSLRLTPEGKAVWE